MTGEDVSDLIDQVKDEVTPPPVLFSGPKGIEVKLQLQAQENSDLIGQHLHREINPYKITVFEYYSKLRTIKKNAKPDKK